MQIHDKQTEQTIRSKQSEYVKHVNDGETDRLVSDLYTKDARFFPPNLPVVKGHDGLRNLFNEMIQSYSNLKYESVDLYASGDLAVAAGTFRLDKTTPDGKTKQETGKFVEGWRHEDDGSWKIFVDTFTTDHEE